MKDVGEIIREKRTAAGLSQAQLAERMGAYIPCTRQAIKKWEEGGGENIGLPYLRGLASVFRCSISDLAEGGVQTSALLAQEPKASYAVTPEESEVEKLFKQLTPSQQEAQLEAMRAMVEGNNRLFEELSQVRKGLPESRPGFRLGGAIIEKQNNPHKKTG